MVVVVGHRGLRIYEVGNAVTAILKHKEQGVAVSAAPVGRKRGLDAVGSEVVVAIHIVLAV